MTKRHQPTLSDGDSRLIVRISHVIPFRLPAISGRDIMHDLPSRHCRRLICFDFLPFALPTSSVDPRSRHARRSRYHFSKRKTFNKQEEITPSCRRNAPLQHRLSISLAPPQSSSHLLISAMMLAHPPKALERAVNPSSSAVVPDHSKVSYRFLPRKIRP